MRQWCRYCLVHSHRGPSGDCHASHTHAWEAANIEVENMVQTVRAWRCNSGECDGNGSFLGVDLPRRVTVSNILYLIMFHPHYQCCAVFPIQVFKITYFKYNVVSNANTMIYFLFEFQILFECILYFIKFYKIQPTWNLEMKSVRQHTIQTYTTIFGGSFHKCCITEEFSSCCWHVHEIKHHNPFVCFSRHLCILYFKCFCKRYFVLVIQIHLQRVFGIKMQYWCFKAEPTYCRSIVQECILLLIVLPQIVPICKFHFSVTLCLAFCLVAFMSCIFSCCIFQFTRVAFAAIVAIVYNIVRFLQWRVQLCFILLAVCY